MHCAKGIGIWNAPATTRAWSPTWSWRPAATWRPRRRSPQPPSCANDLPDLKVRFVNVVDLFKLQPASEHPHGSTDREFDSLFTTDKPVIFNFHGYPWLIHKLATASTTTTTSMCAATRSGQHQYAAGTGDPEPDRPFHPGHRCDRPGAGAGRGAAHLKEQMKNEIIDNLAMRTSTAPTGRRSPTGHGRTNVRGAEPGGKPRS